MLRSNKRKKKDSTTSENVEPAKHSVRCHGCGGYPILGVRYKSKVKWEYNRCQDCFDILPVNSDKQEDFVAIQRPTDTKEVTAGLPELPQPTKEEYIETSPFSNQRDSLDGLRNHPNATLAKLHFNTFGEDNNNDNDGNDSQIWDDLQMAIANHKNIKRMAICNCCLGIGKPIGNNGIIKILRGVAANTSLEYFAMPLRREDRANASDQVRLAFRQLLETNQHLSTFVVWQDLNSKPTAESTVDDAEDLLAKSIFEGLAVNTGLKVLRFDSCSPLSSGAKEFAMESIQKNKDSSLLRLCASFEDDSPHDNDRLDLVLKSKHEKWVERISNTNATKQERGLVLEEVMERYSQNPHMAVHFLAHNCPYLLKTTEEEEDDEPNSDKTE